MVFSNAVKNTSNSTKSNSPTRSEQESQSDYSEDTNVTQFFSKASGMKQTTQRLYRPTATDTIGTKGKGKNKRNLPSQPLTVGGVRVKRARK